MNLDNSISWFQSKIGNYDKQSWERSVEQRILHGLENRPKKESTLNTNLIDVDLVRGTAFSKTKPKHTVGVLLRRGFLRTAFAVLYWDYWSRHTTKHIAAYILFHFFLQIVQAISFVFSESQSTGARMGDVLAPIVLAITVGLLHSQITAAHGIHISSATSTAGSNNGQNSTSGGIFGVPVTSSESTSSYPFDSAAANGQNPFSQQTLDTLGFSSTPPVIYTQGRGAAASHTADAPTQTPLTQALPVTMDCLTKPPLSRTPSKQSDLCVSSEDDILKAVKDPYEEMANEADAESTGCDDAGEADISKHHEPAEDGRRQRGQLVTTDTNQQPLSTGAHRHNRNWRPRRRGFLAKHDGGALQVASLSGATNQAPPYTDNDADIESDPEVSDDSVAQYSLTGHGMDSPNLAVCLERCRHPSVSVRQVAFADSTRQPIAQRRRCDTWSHSDNNWQSVEEDTLHLVLPPERLIEQFKAAKLRGVPDLEVFADPGFDHFRHKPSVVDVRRDKPGVDGQDLKSSSRSRQLPTRSSQISTLRRGHHNVAATTFELSAPCLHANQFCPPSSTQYLHEGGKNATFKVEEFQVLEHTDSNPETSKKVNGIFEQQIPNDVDNCAMGPSPNAVSTCGPVPTSATGEGPITGISANNGHPDLPTETSINHPSTLNAGANNEASCRAMLTVDTEEALNATGVTKPLGVRFVCTDTNPTEFVRVKKLSTVSMDSMGHDDLNPSDDQESADTLTARSRQRAKFMKLFWRRANSQHPQYGLSQSVPNKSSFTFALTPPDPPASCELVGSLDAPIFSSEIDTAVKMASPSMPVPIGNGEDVLDGIPNTTVAKMQLTPTGLIATPAETTSLWPSKKSASGHRTAYHCASVCGPPRRGVSPCRSSYKRANHHLSPDAGSCSSKGQTASETEYDRMNSDVGSDLDTSSASGDSSRDEEPSAQSGGPLSNKSTKATPQTSLLPGKRTSPAEQSQSLKQRGNRRYKPLAAKALSNVKQGSQRTPRKIASEYVASVNQSDKEAPSLMLSANFASQHAAAELSPRPTMQKSFLSADEGAFADNMQDPFALWYMRSLHGLVGRSSTGALETVGCYIWEGDKLKKVNLTLLDIGWSVIKAVERQAVSLDYPRLSCGLVIVLASLPLVFHSGELFVSLSQTNATAHNSGPFTQEVHEAKIRESSYFYAFIACVRMFILEPFLQPDASYFSFLRQTSGLMYEFIISWVCSPGLPGRIVILLGIWLRINLYATILFFLCVAERTFQQRLLYAKHFFFLTSGRRARKARIPHFRLNKVVNVKCWLTLRSYLKKQGPQRSVESILTAAFYAAFILGLVICAQCLSLSKKQGSIFIHLANWDIVACMAAIGLFVLRFITLGTKITKKYRNLFVLLTEQVNLYLSMQKKPHKKEEFTITIQVLRLAESLLKEVDGPFRVCGWSVNPLVYNVFKLVLLSCFSALLSEFLGFKLKLYKLKLNPANW